jgi:peptidoglycan/xylan/chitin deacetylase (PgdA/CDA1 family)
MRLTVLRPWWRSLLFGALLAFGVGLFLVAYQPLWVARALGALFPHIVWRVNTTAPLVALTFDDGPAPDHTPQVLEILAKHRARATFFMVGDRAEAYPDLVAEVRGAGHEIGNHYYTIRSTWRISDDEFLADLRRAEEALELRHPKLFRPPGGTARRSQLRLAAAEGYLCVLGSAYPYDPSHPPAAYIRWLVSKNLAPGVIVVLHDGIADPSRSIAALDDILRAGERKGLQFVTVAELLKGAASRSDGADQQAIEADKASPRR